MKLLFKFLFYVPIAAGAVALILFLALFNYTEFETAWYWSFYYFSLPLLLYFAPVCYFSYKLFLGDYNPSYKDVQGLPITILTIGFSALMTAAVAAGIILVNAWHGEQKVMNLDAVVVSCYTKRQTTDTYITIHSPGLAKDISLQVYQRYKEGDTVKVTLKIGSLGLMYCEK